MFQLFASPQLPFPRDSPHMLSCTYSMIWGRSSLLPNETLRSSCGAFVSSTGGACCPEGDIILHVGFVPVYGLRHPDIEIKLVGDLLPPGIRLLQELPVGVVGEEGRTSVRIANRVAKRHTIGHFLHMKIFSWSDEKNERLKRDRKVSFEAVLFHIERGDLLDIVTDPNQETYGGQQMFVVNIENYVYLAPFVETEEEVLLITIIPSRKPTSKDL